MNTNVLSVVSFIAQAPSWIFLLGMAAAFVLLFQIRILSAIVIFPYIWTLRILKLLGVVHDTREWSVVYDSVSKLPIDPASVRVRDRLGRIVASAVTDLDGRFGALLPPGVYTIEVEKTNYVFPSVRLSGRKTDGFYTGIYTGGPMEVTQGERALAFAIPMDPVGTDWNQVEKKEKQVGLRSEKKRQYRAGAFVYLLIAGVFLGGRLLHAPNSSTEFLSYVYSGLFILWILESFIGNRQYYNSVVVSKETGRPVPFARIKVFTSKNKFQVATKTTSINGQFICLLGRGEYYLTIETRDDKGVYTPVFTSLSFRPQNGSIAQRFEV